VKPVRQNPIESAMTEGDIQTKVAASAALNELSLAEYLDV
jgi:hypothetical protein